MNAIAQPTTDPRRHAKFLYWTGWRITPVRIEFWRDRPFRLHDRLVYARADAASPWTTQRLFP